MTDNSEDTYVVAGVRCHRCGYDLRTLPAHGSCPECGASIAESVRRPRNQVRWRPWDYAICIVMALCAVMLAWKSLTAGRPMLGHNVYRPITFLGALCYAYLSFRLPPLEGRRRRRLWCVGPLILVALFFWYVLMEPWWFEWNLISCPPE